VKHLNLTNAHLMNCQNQSMKLTAGQKIKS